MDKKTIEALYIYLQSQETAQQFLAKCYHPFVTIDAEKKSYENCNMFMYYLEHGKKFYETAEQLDILFQPILLFYGMVHLLKACLLTKRPNYPESTSILAHGVSTRKRKKKNYNFLADEVKVQHHGLLPYFSEHLFSTKPLPFEKVNMETLLALIPEINELFKLTDHNKMVKIGHANEQILQFPVYLLDQYHLTKNAFIQRIKPFLPFITQIELNKQSIVISLKEPLTNLNSPFFLHSDQHLYFPVCRSQFIPIEEVTVHYLILYNLSMISRYETEWWGELIATKPEIDYPFICLFLQITAKKIPLLIGRQLKQVIEPNH